MNLPFVQFVIHIPVWCFVFSIICIYHFVLNCRHEVVIKTELKSTIEMILKELMFFTVN